MTNTTRLHHLVNRLTSIQDTIGAAVTDPERTLLDDKAARAILERMAKEATNLEKLIEHLANR